MMWHLQHAAITFSIAHDIVTNDVIASLKLLPGYHDVSGRACHGKPEIVTVNEHPTVLPCKQY